MSPNSGLVAYQSGGSLLVKPVGAGPPVNLGPVSTWGGSLDYDWAPDGHSLAVVRNVVIGNITHRRPFRVPYPNGVALDLGTDGRSPSWSPDNVHFACATNSLILVFNVAGQPYVQVPNSGGAESVFWQPQRRADQSALRRPATTATLPRQAGDAGSVSPAGTVRPFRPKANRSPEGPRPPTGIAEVPRARLRRASSCYSFL